MEISKRLNCIASMIEPCGCIADIGTDHGYLPIFLVKNGISLRAIASDINRGPVEKAKRNVLNENADDKIICRLGAGLSVLKIGEADCAVIAGMGGNLIRDIIEDDIEVFKSLNYAVLQPVQNAEVLREYLITRGFNIIDEDICTEENKYYEIIKVSYGESPRECDSIYFEISEVLLHKKNPLLKEFILRKIKKYEKIYVTIKDEGELAQIRKSELLAKLTKLKELLKCF